MAVFTETIELKDNVTEQAKKASAQVVILTKALESTQKSLVKAQALGDTQTVNKLTEKISGYKSALNTLPAAQDKAAVGAMGITEELAGLTGGLSLVAEAIGAVAVGFLALTVAGAKFAITSTQAKQQAMAMFDALGEGKITGQQVDDMLDGMSSKLGITKDAMAPLVKEFMAMGVTSQDALEKMTTAALSAKALVGGAESGAQAFTALTKKIQLAGEAGTGLKIPIKGLGALSEMGLTVDDVAKKMGLSTKVLTQQLSDGSANAAKFGDALQEALIEKGAGPLKKMSLGLSNIGEMFQQYIGDMFEDMGDDVGPFLEQIRDLFSIFDSKSKPSGEAMKKGIGAFFKEAFSIATKVVPLIKHFLLDVVIYSLKAYITLKPLIATFKEWWASAEKAGYLTKALVMIKASLITIAIVIGAVVAVAGLLVAAFVAIAGVVWLVEDAIGNFVIGSLKALYNWIASAPQMAIDFVMGLVNGITGAGSMVTDAVKGLADGAVKSFKSTLGISSPSKVMAGLGGHTGAGFAQGLEDTGGDVHGAASGVADKAVAGASSAPPVASGGSSGGGGVNAVFEPGSIVINGAGKDAETITEEMLSTIFQRVALESGL